MLTTLGIGRGKWSVAAGGGGGDIAVDFTGTPHNNSGGSYVTSLSVTDMTVGTGDNRCLWAVLISTQAMSSPSVSWNSTDMSSPIKSIEVATGAWVYVFQMVNPASGNNTLAASWTGSTPAALAGVCLANVDQTTPRITGDDVQPTGADSDPSSGAITSSAEDATLALATCHDRVSESASNFQDTGETQTNVFRQTATAACALAASIAQGGTTNTHAFDIVTEANRDWCVIGLHVNKA